MNPYTQGYVRALEKLGVKGKLINKVTGLPFFKKQVPKMELGMAERAFGGGGGRPPLNPKYKPLPKV